VTVAEQVAAERALSGKLEAYLGEWVAVRDHEVVAHAGRLHDLLAQIDPEQVDGVFQVLGPRFGRL
jgi:hypothetical protein